MSALRVLVYGGLAVVVLATFVWPQYKGRFVRADSATAFAWDTAAFVTSRGNCHTRGTARNIRGREGWQPGRGRYILTLQDTSGADLVRGKLWLTDDIAADAPSSIAGYGAVDADFAALPHTEPTAAAAARRTDSRAPGVILHRDTTRTRHWLTVALSADSSRTLRLEIDVPGGDGFSGAWFLGDSVMRGGFCAGWIDV